MVYYSTNNVALRADFREATIQGQAPDKGLYYPSEIPKLQESFVANLKQYSKEAIALEVIRPYVGKTIPDNHLVEIVAETINFPFPLIQINERIASLELYHGPTLAFKDVGARFMSRCLGYFNRNNNKKVTVLVATSGDTGGAVANGFENIDGIEVIILYPSGKVSPVQERQLTTCGSNIYALEIQGSFDDCQAIVKQAFMDADFQESYQLTSANSINVARWLPQQFYYFFAQQQWVFDEAPVVCVPSGNFGNICAGMLANCSGLPVRHFIAACNANDTIDRYLKTGELMPQLAVATISNAMDVAVPSNFIRIMTMYHHSMDRLKKMLSTDSISDDETLTTMKNVSEKYRYQLDPHGAVAYVALEKYLNEHGGMGYFLETAHPVKFPEPVQRATTKEVDIPASILPIMEKEKVSILLPASYDAVKEWMLHR